MTRAPLNPAPPQATYATMPPASQWGSREIAQHIAAQRRAEAEEIEVLQHRVEFELDCDT